MKTKLEKQFRRRFNLFGFDTETQYTILVFLDLLKVKDYPTYEHSLRVAMLSADIAGYCGYDMKPAFISGALHDIGKALVLPKSLKATIDFHEEDYKEVKKHVLYSCKLLHGILNFTADVVLRHHIWQTNGYPTFNEN